MTLKKETEVLVTVAQLVRASSGAPNSHAFGAGQAVGLIPSCPGRIWKQSTDVFLSL